MPHPLNSFFAPESIALIGASRDHEKIPGRLLSMLRKNDYPGKLYPINPNYEDIDGLKCYKSIADVGAPIDLAVVLIPARAVLAALEQCATAGVKNAVIISSGFAEEGGDSAAMQDAIVALAKIGHAGFRTQCRRVLQSGPARRRNLQPHGRCQAGRTEPGCDHKADRHRRPERRHRLCDLPSRQGAGRGAELRRQRRQ